MSGHPNTHESSSQSPHQTVTPSRSKIEQHHPKDYHSEPTSPPEHKHLQPGTSHSTGSNSKPSSGSGSSDARHHHHHHRKDRPADQPPMTPRARKIKWKLSHFKTDTNVVHQPILSTPPKFKHSSQSRVQSPPPTIGLDRDSWRGWWTRPYSRRTSEGRPVLGPVNDPSQDHSRQKLWLLLIVPAVLVFVIVVVVVVLLVFAKPAACSDEEKALCLTEFKGNECIYLKDSHELLCQCEHKDFKRDDGPTTACIRKEECLRSMKEKCRVDAADNKCIMNSEADYTCLCNPPINGVSSDNQTC